MLHSVVRIRHTSSSSPGHHRPLPTGNYLLLCIDDVPTAGDDDDVPTASADDDVPTAGDDDDVPTSGADNARRLILALAPADKELVKLSNEMQAWSAEIM